MDMGMSNTSALDHITVTAPNLNVGAAYVQRCLGVEMQAGGEHPRMGTHNLLLRLGDALFLEVIAPNPDAPRPDRARWFGLDRLQAESPAALTTWVVRCDDIHGLSAQTSEPLGKVEPMTRGALHWHITIPESGDVPLDGVAPSLIEWPPGMHPARQLTDFGLSLQRLVIRHPQPERVSSLLTRLKLHAPVAVCACTPAESAGLKAEIQTPAGLRTLGFDARLSF